MKLYEVPFIVANDAPPQAVDAIARRFAGVIQKDGGKVNKCEYVGTRDFAYKIGKFSSGRYYILYVELDPSSIAEINLYFRTNENVIRHAFYIINSMPEKASWIVPSDAVDSEFSTIFTSLLVN